jgi:hypothetical protein
VFWAKGINLTACFPGQGLFKVCGVNGLTANPAMDQVQGLDFVPLVFQKVLEFNGLLRTDSPAIGTPDAFGHIMQNGTVFVCVFKSQCVCGTVLHARQASITVFVYHKIGHGFSSPATAIRVQF